MRAMGTVQPYCMGITVIALVSGATPTLVSPSARTLGFMVTKNGGSNGGTLAIANGFGASTGNSYILGDTEHFEVNGPAAFYMCAGGATCKAVVVTYYDQGYSLGGIF